MFKNDIYKLGFIFHHFFFLHNFRNCLQHFDSRSRSFVYSNRKLTTFIVGYFFFFPAHFIRKYIASNKHEHSSLKTLSIRFLKLRITCISCKHAIMSIWCNYKLMRSKMRKKSFIKCKLEVSYFILLKAKLNLN